MKKILYIGIAVLLTSFFYSCESFLDTKSTDTYNEVNWWQTESQAISSINGCYAVLRSSGIYNYREDNLTPNSYGMSTEIQLAQGEHNSSNYDYFLECWDRNYRGIGRVNTLLDNIDRVQMTESIKERIRAEGYFLRALFYSNLVNYFGGVPLILESPNFVKQGNLPRNSREEVITQVLTDLDNAASVLPVSFTGSDIGRATKGAALGLKTRVLLYNSRWSEAATSAKAVMDLNYYSLFADYRGLFFPENENNKEVIFDVQYCSPDYTSSMDIGIESQMGTSPTLDLVNSYLMKDGKSIQESPLYDPATPYENRDPRLLQTIVIPGYLYLGRIVPDGKYYSTEFGYKKYTSYKDDKAEPQNSKTEINYILLRYADILLMYAEAQNEAAGADASVYDALHKIRLRAGMPDIPGGLSKDQMRDAIRHERRIELANEALYYNDIRRWRTAEVVNNGNVISRLGKVVQIRIFNPQKDYLWPIHDITMQENPALVQNPGY